jgi:hypothetical protein
MVLSLEKRNAFQFNSTLGIARTLFPTGIMQIQFTQFTNGYSYPNKEVSVSRPLAYISSASVLNIPQKER